MSKIFRNILVILAFLALIVGAFIFVQPYIARLIFSWQNDPFTIVSKSLKTDPSPTVRGEAAKTLVSIDRARAVPNLIEALKTDPDIRLDIMDALIRAGKPAVPALLNYAKSDLDISNENDVEIIAMILGAVSEIDTSNTIIKAKDDRQYLIEIIKDTHLSIDARSQAVSLLGKITVEDLEKIHSNLDNPELRITVIEKIGDSKDVNLVLSLIEYFYYDENAEVRQSTLSAMGKLLEQEQQAEENSTTEDVLPISP